MANTEKNPQPKPVQEKEWEIIITFIGGKIHRWNFFPGTWDPFTPLPGDLLRVWKDPHK